MDAAAFNPTSASLVRTRLITFADPAPHRPALSLMRRVTNISRKILQINFGISRTGIQPHEIGKLSVEVSRARPKSFSGCEFPAPPTLSALPRTSYDFAADLFQSSGQTGFHPHLGQHARHSAFSARRCFCCSAR